jgi:chromosome partitioning protein
MSVVVIAAEKGGPGKSTLTQSVAAVRAGLRSKCVIFDLDGQGTSVVWGETRAEDNPQLPTVDVKTLEPKAREKPRDAFARELDKLLGEYSDVFIDVGGKDTDLFRAAMVAADRIVVPLEPSPADLNTVPKLAGVVDELERSLRRKLKIGILLNKSSGSKRILNEMIEGLEQFKAHVPLLKDRVGTRVAFKFAMARGLGVHELTGREFDPLAALEIKNLYLEIFGK